MERIEVLIAKLKEQYDQKADPAQMMTTVQLIESELSQMPVKSIQNLGTSKVAVTMPRSINMSSYSTPATYIEKPAYEPLEKQSAENIHLSKEPTEIFEEKEINQPMVKKNDQVNFAFDPMVEIPTLSHQHKAKEINEAISIQKESLNDTLKQERVELVEILKESPIKDLRKAIGINDRFVFISELFRGDEAMYERSIKTINGFNIYAEAEYWINRELKTKIGWDDTKNIVQHFYQLVKRRFS